MGEDTSLDSDDDSASSSSTTKPPPSDPGIPVEVPEEVEDDDNDRGSDDDSCNDNDNAHEYDDGNDNHNDNDDDDNDNDNDNGNGNGNGNSNEEEDYGDGNEGDDMPELACPFCFKFFDAVGMFCHIHDAHPAETKFGKCPLCAASMGTNMAAHVTTEHKSILHRLYRKKLGNGDTGSILSSLRKELQDGHLQSVSKESSEPDPLLSSFIYMPTTDDVLEIVQLSSEPESSPPELISDGSMLTGNIESCPFSDKDQEGNAHRREFLQGILLSTMLDDNL